MEVINENDENSKQKSGTQYHHQSCDYYDEKYTMRHRMSKIFIGIAVLVAGVLLLLRQTGSEIPHWLLSWPMVLVVGGMAAAIKHGFRRIHPYVIMLIGLLFLADKIYGNLELKPYIWPLVIMIIGLIIIFKPRRKHWRHHRHHWKHNYARDYYYEKKKYGTMNNEDFLDVNAVFGTVTRNVISKNFKGGEVNAAFGGAEINLSQADFEGTVELELNQVFGGTKLIVPSHWRIQAEQSAVFGGIEDKRPVMPATSLADNKVLVLKGNCVFGGIEIRSY